MITHTPWRMVMTGGPQSYWPDPSTVWGKKETDLLLSFEGTRVLNEENSKEDEVEYLARHGEHLSTDDIHSHSIPLRRTSLISCPDLTSAFSRFSGDAKLGYWSALE